VSGGQSGQPATSSGTDPSLGSFDELMLPFGASVGDLAVRYFAAADAFVFQRLPATTSAGRTLLSQLPTTWPAFSITERMDEPLLRCIGWSEHYFFPVCTHIVSSILLYPV
jgi:hypothetical protein